MKTFLTSIILVHYGQIETTAACLSRLAVQSIPARIIVSNNGSLEDAKALYGHSLTLTESTVMLMPGDFGQLQEPSPQVTIVHNDGNRGFAAGCNIGISMALRSGAQYIWLLNNDTVPSKDALENLEREALVSPNSILGATVVRPSDNISGQRRIQVAGGKLLADHDLPLSSSCEQGRIRVG